MPIDVKTPGEILPGELFEDCRFHPCLCIEGGAADDPSGVYGISLVDGTPSGCSIYACGLRKLTIEEVVQWKHHGPSDVELEPRDRWWEQRAT